MKLKRKLCNNLDINTQIDNGCEPVVYTGMTNQTTVLTFNDYFEHETITKLINDIESVRQVGGYEYIDLYFTSNGGSADSLFMLADYFNNIKDIKINIIVTGMVASSGFYILLLIENHNINIVFNKHCSGLIHLGDVYVSCRGRLSSEESRYNYDKFVDKDLENLNNYFETEILPKLKLSKKDRKHISDGKDLMLHAKELEDVVKDYHDKKYIESDEFLEQYMELIQKLNIIQDTVEDMKTKYKNYTKKDLDEELFGSENGDDVE